MTNIYKIRSDIDYVPYTYIIGWRSHNVWYFGSETACRSKIANPKNLWTIYFTSSDRVSEYRDLHGEPDVIKIVAVYRSAEEARMAESAYLTRINAAKRTNWLNQHNGNDKFNTAGKKWITDGVQERQIEQHDPVPAGWTYGQSKISRPDRKFSVDAAAKAAESKRGKTIINDGVRQKFHYPHLPLPEGFTWGQTEVNKRKAVESAKGKRKITQEFRDKVSIQHKGKIVSQTTRLRQSLAQKQIRWVTNGIDNLKIKNSEPIPLGYRYGRTYNKFAKSGRI